MQYLSGNESCLTLPESSSLDSHQKKLSVEPLMPTSQPGAQYAFNKYM